MALIAIETVDFLAVSEGHAGVNIGGAGAYPRNANGHDQQAADTCRIASWRYFS
jgi:hypothetical protein